MTTRNNYIVITYSLMLLHSLFPKKQKDTQKESSRATIGSTKEANDGM